MIEFTKLLGVHLKDDLIIEILEAFEMDVIYDFDRFHENADDVYWARAHGFAPRDIPSFVILAEASTQCCRA